MTNISQMRNIAHKVETLRTAIAESVVRMRPSTIQLLRDGNAPKGDPLPLAKVSAIIAAKKTSELIPYCHPLLVDAVTVDFELGEDSVTSTVTVTAVAKTGVEMEALTAASLASLTIYDMLKPVDDDLEILNCRLLKKTGGKSSYPKGAPEELAAAVLVISDRASRGERDDRSGKVIQQYLRDWGIDDATVSIVPDDRETIAAKLKELADGGARLVLTTGGTGLGPRDVTAEATRDVIDREALGIAEAMRAYGQKRTPFSMMSAGVAGIRGRSLIINLPGSPAGVEDSMKAIFPAVFHAFGVMDGATH